MRRWLIGLALATASLASTGCYKATFIDPNAIRGEEHEEWTDFFIFGLVGEEDYDVRRSCSGPVALVRTGGNFLTGFVTVITIGIYAPRKVYVTCAAAPGAASAELDVELDSAGVPTRARKVHRGQTWVGRPERVAGIDGAYRVRLRKEGSR